MKLKLTIELEYEADPEHYGTEDAMEMAEIDCRNIQDNPLIIFEILGSNPFQSKVIPIEESKSILCPPNT